MRRVCQLRLSRVPPPVASTPPCPASAQLLLLHVLLLLLLLLWHLQSSAAPGATRDASIESKIDFTPLSHVFQGFRNGSKPRYHGAFSTKKKFFCDCGKVVVLNFNKVISTKGLRTRPRPCHGTLSKLVANNFINKIYGAFKRMLQLCMATSRGTRYGIETKLTNL